MVLRPGAGLCDERQEPNVTCAPDDEEGGAVKPSGKREVAEDVLIAVLSAAGVKLVEYIAERIEEKRRATIKRHGKRGSKRGDS
jgi:hypothetical protein